jgi:hypothetical protein
MTTNIDPADETAEGLEEMARAARRVLQDVAGYERQVRAGRGDLARDDALFALKTCGA